MLPADAPDWVREHVTPVGPVEITRERPWATVARVPVAGGCVWFKACARFQSFEARLTSTLCARWPDQMPTLIACDEDRGWLLLHDAGTLVRDLGNPPELWLQALPSYAELQRGEAGRASEHLDHGVPDLRTEALPTKYAQLLRPDLPIDDRDREHLRAFEPTFALWCAELADGGVADSIQHDDLHHGNLYLDGGRTRILDWGDSSISHPFASLVVTFRFLERINGLDPSDRWFSRLRDAYLEPWGAGHEDLFDLASRVGRFSYAIAWIRQRDPLDRAQRATFDEEYALVLRRALDVVC